MPKAIPFDWTSVDWKKPVNARANAWLAVQCSAPDPDEEEEVEMLIYGEIGRDWMTEDGVQAKEFAAALKAIPSNRKITVRINSPGGNVWDGLAIYNMLKARGEGVICRIDGIAASIASIIALGGSKCVMPKSAMMMMHNPTALCVGDSDDMRAAAAKLDSHAKVLAGIYVANSELSEVKVRHLMDAETWLTGEQCKEHGLCDETIEEEPVKNTFDLSTFRAVPGVILNQADKPSAALAAAANNKPTNNAHVVMNREEMIALLKTRGVAVADTATDEWLKDEVKKLTIPPAAATSPPPPAAPPANMLDIQKQLDAMKAERDRERKARIEREVDNCIAEDRIPAVQRPFWVEQCVKNEVFVAQLKAMPPKPPGVPSPGVEIVSDAIEDIAKGFKSFRAPLDAFLQLRTDSPDCRAIGANAIATARAMDKHRERIIPVMNANTIDSDLKRQFIMSESMRAFKRRIVPLSLFAHTYQNVPLEGLDTVIVPYYPLYTTASLEFAQATGYVHTAAATTTSKKSITVGGVADGTTNGRLYQPLRFTAYDFARQPWLDIAKLGALSAEQLSIDLFNTVCSIITAANYGGPVVAKVPQGFTASDVADIQTALNQADWPEPQRSLVLDSAYYGNLLKDPYVKAYLNIGDTGAIREARVGGLYGFADTVQCPRIPSNNEALKGWASFPSAVLVATAPILPAPGERKLMLSYDIVTDPDTGVTFQYKYWGEPQYSRDNEVIEVCFGYAAGELAALKRICNG